MWSMPLYMVCTTDVVVRDPTYRGAYRAVGYVIHHTFLVRTACVVVATVGVAQNVSLFMVRTGLTPGNNSIFCISHTRSWLIYNN